MIKFKASFINADDCDFALGELQNSFKVTNSIIQTIYGKSDGDLPVNYPDTPISDVNSAFYLDGKDHILEGTNVNNDYLEIGEKSGVKLTFTVADSNKSKANRILLKFKAFDISISAIPHFKRI